MYRLISPEAIMNNLIVMSSPYIEDRTSLDDAKLKHAYIEFLNQVQPHCPNNLGPDLVFADAETESSLSGYFSGEEVDTTDLEKKIDLDQVMYPDPAIRRDALLIALNYMEMIDRSYTDVFKLLINTIFCTTSKRIGGTSVNPRYIGVICAYHDMYAEQKAVPELLIHEFTHNTLFLDELRYGHYDYTKLRDPKTFIAARDRGLKVKFPVNRCLHSLVVSAEVLLARDTFLGHEPIITQHLSSDEIRARSRKYVAILKKDKSVLSDRGKEIFDYCEQFFSK